jgi:hypothetical protein
MCHNLLLLLLLLLLQFMKVVAYSFNGVQPIDSNKEFVSEVLAAAPGKKFIVMCEAGGTMRGSVNFLIAPSCGMVSA